MIITASIVVYKTQKQELQQVMECALASSIQKIFIIDNSPTNELQSLVEGYSSDRVVYQWGQGNIGYGAAHNIAIKQSFKLNANYHVVLNSDIIFSQEVIQQLANFMQNHPEVGMVMPNVVYPDGSIQRLCKLLPTPLDIFARRLLPKKWINNLNMRYEMHFMGYNKIWNCPSLSGCFMLLRNEVLNEVGDFDERFFMYFEDIDLVRRIHRISKTFFFPEVTIIHAHRAEHRTSNKLLKISIRSTIQYFNKYGWFWDKERREMNHQAQTPNAQFKK